jgi:hypothetical protein
MAFLLALSLAIGFATIGAVIWQWFWTFTGMDVWTRLGPIPFSCAFFLVFALAAARGSSSK